MKSTRDVMMEKGRHSSNVLRMGTIIKVGIEGQTEAIMMISAIVTNGSDSDNNLYLLLTAHSKVATYKDGAECSLVRAPGQSRLMLGILVSPKLVLGPDAEKLGFHVMQLHKTPLFGELRSCATPLATVRNFRRGIWGSGNFRVRMLNRLESLGVTRSKYRNSAFNFTNRKGRVAGEIEAVKVPDQGKIHEYSYCGLVTRGRRRLLAEKNALGAPLIAESGALSAIIVGAVGKETLVFPVEELRKGRNIEFMTLGDDWPKVKTASIRSASSSMR